MLEACAVWDLVIMRTCRGTTEIKLYTQIETEVWLMQTAVDNFEESKNISFHTQISMWTTQSWT